MFIKASQLTEEKTAHGGFKVVLLKTSQVPHIPQVAIGALKQVFSAEPYAHAHETMWELYYVLEGRAKYHIGEEVCEAGPGDFVAVPPKTRHFQEVLEAPHRFLYWGVASEE